MFFKYARSQKVSLIRDFSEANIIKLAERKIAINPQDNFYIEDWAISAFEDYGPNYNWDGFERAELKLAYKTFEGSWVCLDHQNWDESLSIGTNIDAVYTPQNYVKVLMGVNKKLAEARFPGIQSKIENGTISDTSMGAWCKYSVCHICDNVAYVPGEYCDHVREPIRGKTICTAETNWKPKIACELNKGCVFFENSIITQAEGADSNAKILAKIASSVRGCGKCQSKTGSIYVPGDKLYSCLKQLASEAHGENDKMHLAHLVERLTMLLDEEK